MVLGKLTFDYNQKLYVTTFINAELFDCFLVWGSCAKSKVQKSLSMRDFRGQDSAIEWINIHINATVLQLISMQDGVYHLHLTSGTESLLKLKESRSSNLAHRRKWRGSLLYDLQKVSFVFGFERRESNWQLTESHAHSMAKESHKRKIVVRNNILGNIYCSSISSNLQSFHSLIWAAMFVLPLTTRKVLEPEVATNDDREIAQKN